MLLPALNKARQKGLDASCRGKLKQWGTYIHIYANDNRDFFFVSPQMTNWQEGSMWLVYKGYIATEDAETVNGGVVKLMQCPVSLRRNKDELTEPTYGGACLYPDWGKVSTGALSYYNFPKITKYNNRAIFSCRWWTWSGVESMYWHGDYFNCLIGDGSVRDYRDPNDELRGLKRIAAASNYATAYRGFRMVNLDWYGSTNAEGH